MSGTNREATSQRRQRSRPAAPDALADGAASVQSTPPADPRLARLHQLYEVVADAGAALNIPPARLAEGEALERLEVVARLTVEQFARLRQRPCAWMVRRADRRPRARSAPGRAGSRYARGDGVSAGRQ